VRITIFGATGRTGHLLAGQALAAGHQVTAYARHPERLRIVHRDLRTVGGELDDDAAIRGAVRGADAVIEGVGAVSEGTRRIVTAMQDAGVTRLVAISTCSAEDPADRPDPKVRALVRLVKTAAPGPYAQVRAAAQIIRASDLDWTLVRVARLTSRPAAGAISAGYYGHGAIGLSITRADLAAFLLSQATGRTFVRQAPAISN
jgi:putative NADH-flavin reductase